MDTIQIVQKQSDDAGVIRGILYDCTEQDRYIGLYVSIPHGGTDLLHHIRVHSYDELFDIHIKHAFRNMNEFDVQLAAPLSREDLMEINAILGMSKLSDLSDKSTIDMEDAVIQAFAILFYKLSHKNAKLACGIRKIDTGEEYGVVCYQLLSGSILHGIAKNSDIIKDNLHNGWWGLEEVQNA